MGFHMATVPLKHLSKDVDRHGNVRWYVRKRGMQKIRLEGLPGSERFAECYHAALKGIRLAKAAPIKKKTGKPGSFRRLVEGYYDAAVFTTMEPSSRHARKLILDKLCETPWKDTGKTVGDLPYKSLRKRHVREMRDWAAAEAPEAANSRLKAIRQVLSFAVDDDEIEHSPADDVDYIASKGSGFHTWTVEEIRQYEKRHPIGTMARLALALLAFLGQRRSDTVLFGEHMVRVKDGRRFLRFTQFKGRNKSPIELELPILPELEQIIQATPRVKAKAGKPIALTFLQTEFGLSFSRFGFGNKLRDWCDEAGLYHCSAHGLRKAGATIAAENGASTHDLMSIFGWKTLKEAARYTEKVRKHLLAAKNMHKIVPEQTEGESVPPFDGVAKAVRKKGKNSK